MDNLNKDFREIISAALRKLKPMMTQDHFPPIQTEDLQQLKLRGALLPGLIGQDGRLAYQNDVRLDKMDKEQYKAYLKTILANLKTLLKTLKETIRKISLTNQLSKTKVAGQLQKGVTGKEHISVAEHAKILQAQVAFQGATIDTIRRALLSLGVVLSNLCLKIFD